MTSVARKSAILARLAFAVCALAVAGACNSSSEPSAPPKDVTPATITALSSDTLRAAAGSATPSALTVTVMNKAGEPIDSAVVTFAVASGGGALSATNVRTNASGQASTTWTLGNTATAQTVTASAGTLSPVTFVAIATAGGAASIAKLAGDTQAGVVNTNLPILPSVKVTDKFGNPVPGQLVTFTAGSNGGLVSGGAVNTDANGVATITGWRLGAAVGTYTITASAGANVSTTFTANAVAGAPATVALTPTGPFALDAGQTTTVAARVSDAAGNVLASAPVTYTSANESIATVSGSGVITAVGAGITTVTATSGSATATVTLNVTGHPTGTAVATTLPFNSDFGGIAFTKSSMAIGLNLAQQVAFFDPSGTNQQGTALQLTQPVSILLGGRNSAGPLLAISQGTTSRIFYVDPASQTVTDSIDISESVTSAAITSDGAKAYFLLADGELAVLNVASRSLLPRIPLGGGTTKIKVDQGDTLAYVATTVGIMFEIDTRSNTVKRQIILPSVGTVTDFTISRDGQLIYMLDGLPGLVRIFRVSTFALQRTASVSPNASSIALSPDDRQLWLTHTNPTQVTWYTGTPTTGYVFTGEAATIGLPFGIFFSPTGSFAAITELGGNVEIIR